MIPASVDTYGPEFGALMRRARKPGERWQQDSIDIIGSVRADGLWACPEYCEWCSRQNGKGWIGEARALGGFLLLDEQLISWSAHEYKTAMEAFRRVRWLIRRLGTSLNENLVRIDDDVVVDERGDPVLVKINNTNGEESFERKDTEQRIKFIARSKGSGRGFTGWTTILDEAFALTAEHEEALAPTEVATPNPQTIYLSSPPLTGITGEVMFGLRERAEEGDDSLGYRDWGQPGDLDKLDEIDLDDIALWAESNPALGPAPVHRLTLEKLSRQRRRLRSNGGRGFAREFLGIWPARAEGGGAIDMEMWATLVDPDSVRDGDCSLAVAISPARAWTAIGLYAARSDGLGHLQLVDYFAGTARIVPRLVELRGALPLLAIGMSSGTFASLETALAEEGFELPAKPDEPKRGQLAVLKGQDMAAACGQLIDGVKQRDFRIRQHAEHPEVLDDAAKNAQTREGLDSITWVHTKSSVDVTPLRAVTEARWTHLTRVDAVKPPAAPATANTAPTGDNRHLWRPSERLTI